MEPLLLALIAAAALVGATGAWSPCGLSMIETIGPGGHSGGVATTLAAAAAFAPFALLGGALTFGLLGLVGSLLAGAGSTVAYVLAAAIAAAAAFAEARGLPIAPQVRRQLPVGWRSRVPMPLAAAGYGVLLGLGFTTFVLSYGVWALIAVSLVLGDPVAGLAIGLAFGAGRALPIAVLAPIAEREAGIRACEAMTMRPGLLRGARAGDAVALGAVAVTLALSASTAGAARSEQPNASDPAAAGSVVAYEQRNGTGVLRTRSGGRIELPGSDPAVGGPWVALVSGGSHVRILAREGLRPAGSIPAAGVDGLDVTKRWVAYRVKRGSRDTIFTARLGPGGKPGKRFRIARAGGVGQLSRPAVDRDRVVYAVAKKRKSRLVSRKLRGGGPASARTLFSSRKHAVSGPSISGKRIAYALASRKAQRIRIKGLGKGKGRSIYKRRGSGPPTLWTTAIAGKRVWFTVVKGGGGARLLSVSR
jgi:hypothetical protein